MKLKVVVFTALVAAVFDSDSGTMTANAFTFAGPLQTRNTQCTTTAACTTNSKQLLLENHARSYVRRTRPSKNQLWMVSSSSRQELTNNGFQNMTSGASLGKQSSSI
jgi:hypothetical protein